MSRMSILTPVITAAFFAVSTPAIGADALLVELSSEASRSANNDLMQATVSAEASGASPGDISAQINQSIAAALNTAKAFPNIKVKTGNTTTYPVYSKQGKIESWRMRSDIVLESSDAALLSGLLGKLQTSLTVTSLIASPSHETRRKAENEAMINAIALFRERATLLAEQLGKSYSIKEMSISATGHVPRPLMRAARSMSQEIAPMPVEAGESQVVISVSGKIAIE